MTSRGARSRHVSHTACVFVMALELGSSRAERDGPRKKTRLFYQVWSFLSRKPVLKRDLKSTFDSFQTFCVFRFFSSSSLLYYSRLNCCTFHPWVCLVKVVVLNLFPSCTRVGRTLLFSYCSIVVTQDCGCFGLMAPFQLPASTTLKVCE